MRSRRSVPAARASDLLVEQIGSETVVYDLETKEAHCLKGLAAVVFSEGNGGMPLAEMAALAQSRLGEPVTEADVAGAIDQLSERNLLDEPLAVRDGLSRRDMVRRSAFAGAVAFAAPLITSIAAPTAAMAQSGIPSGCTGCGQNKDCVSNHCCQSVPGKQCNQTCCVADNNSCHFTNCTGTCDCTARNPTCTCTCDCTVVLSGCGSVVCPPGSTKCCTTS